MDIYQRTCIKDGILVDDLKEGEIEILDAESNSEACNEEEECEVEEKLDIKALQDELECMKRRIQKMQLRLKMMDIEPCPEEECVDFEIELKCSENKEICALQKGHHKLQCQIYELVQCCKFAKDQIKDLRQRMCEKSREILQLQKMVGVLESWRLTLEHEFGVCIERFEYLKHVKAEWMDVVDILDKQTACFVLRQETCVPKRCFIQEKKHFLAEIKDLHDMFRQFFNASSQRFQNLERAVGISPGLPRVKREKSPCHKDSLEEIN